MLQAGFSKAFVVLGFDEQSFARQIASLPVEIVANPRFADGLSTSLQAGIEALDMDTDGVLVMLADMPALTAPPTSPNSRRPSGARAAQPWSARRTMANAATR